MSQENTLKLNAEDEAIILTAMQNHNLQLNPKDYNLQALVRYVRQLGYSEGYKDGKMIGARAN